jgi:methyltransferase (TIGR00027 family)
MKQDKPSNTALIVAAGLQLARENAGPTAGATRLGEQLLRRAYPRLAGLLRRGWFRRLCKLLEHATLPGICLHFALRKQLLRQHANGAIAAGCTQVVVLGAGLDTLCMELKAARPDLCCFEIDHPATQSVKRAAVDGSGIGFIAADLARQELGVLLKAHPNFRPDASTLFVAEGLLMYMPLDAVRALFAHMAAAAPHSQVAFTWFEPLADGRPNFRPRSRLIDAWLRWRGEPFQSGVARAELARFLSGAGFVLQNLNASSDLLATSGATKRPIEGEYIALASSVRENSSASLIRGVWASTAAIAAGGGDCQLDEDG